MMPFEALVNLFGYLHEDWAEDYPTAWDAVAAFAADEPVYAPQTRADIAVMVDQFATEDELREELLALGLAYRPGADGWNSHRVWLLAVSGALDRMVSAEPAPT